MTSGLQPPFDVGIVMVTVVRDTLPQAVRSVFAQAFGGRMQILVGVDRWQGDRTVVESLAREAPSHIAVTTLDLGYSVLYQVPVPFRSVDLAVPLIAELSRHPNIIGVKDSTGDLSALGELGRTCADGFAVIVGTAAVLQDALDAGASAGILGLAAVAPFECTEIHRLWLSGEHEEAARIQAVAAPLHRAVVAQFGVPGVKAALDILGLAGGPPRSPLRPLGPAERAVVEQAINSAALVPR